MDADVAEVEIAEADEDQVREMRRILRQIHTHLTEASLAQGAAREGVGLVDVIHHPTNGLPSLNYVTPRRNTAWISGKDIESGLDDLRGRQRPARIEYIEGLFPPLFAKTLDELGLEVVSEQAMMVFQQGVHTLRLGGGRPDGVAFDEARDHHAAALWWYIWRNAHYDVITSTAEPAFIGGDLAHIARGAQINILMYRYGFPVGAAQVSVLTANHSAQISALAVMKQWRTPEFVRALQAYTVKAALDAGASLVFITGVAEHERPLLREVGLADCGSVVCYGEKLNGAHAHKPAPTPVAMVTATAAISAPPAKDSDAHGPLDQPVHPPAERPGA